MKAILQYVQKVIASAKDGTICITIDTGDVGTLTIKSRTVVAASLEDLSGRQALEAIKLATISHMEFWMGITRKSDIQKMIRIQADTNALSPIPEDEMHPEGAPLVLDSDEHEDALDSKPELRPGNTMRKAAKPSQLSEKDIETLSTALIEYIGPAASILIEGSLDQARDIDHLIELLSEELFSDKDRMEFSHKAYFLLGQI